MLALDLVSSQQPPNKALRHQENDTRLKGIPRKVAEQNDTHHNSTKKKNAA
jgi:hypothetical protein